MKGPRPARMPVYGAGSKCLGRTEKETEWLRFHAPQPPGNFHCARTAGVFSFFCELKVKNGTIDGYIKPLFRHMKVYDARKDAEKSLFHKLYEKLIGGVAKLLEKRERKEVATETHVEGPVDNPRSSTLQIVLRLIENAFFRAILPGFDSSLSHLASAGSSKK